MKITIMKFFVLALGSCLKTARFFAYNKHKLRFYCHKIFISSTFHEYAFSNHGFYNDTTVHIPLLHHQ